ncbi:Late embryogenesis abundant protein [Theobroma cacao]|nr:Late embryogenesis abundant protein [Theobroma cacao]
MANGNASTAQATQQPPKHINLAYNPNSRISLYYDYMESAVTYEDQTLAFNTVEPFFQPHRNATRVESKLTAQNLALSPSIFKDIKVEKASGEIQVDVHFKSKIRFKVGVWKSRHRILRIVCSSVTVHFSWYKHFDKNTHQYLSLLRLRWLQHQLQSSDFLLENDYLVIMRRHKDKLSKATAQDKMCPPLLTDALP